MRTGIQEADDAVAGPEAGGVGSQAGPLEPAPAPAPEMPRFLQGFPEDEALAPLVAAFLSGDYATLRRDAPRLAETAPDPAVRRAAAELRRRIDPDPLAVYLLAASILLLLLMIAWSALGHQH